MTNTFSIRFHPLLITDRIIARRGTDLTFTYSRYMVTEPGRHSAAPYGPVLRVHARDLTPGWLLERLRDLGPTEEMAFHSWVECGGAGFHIPMADFVNPPDRFALRKLHYALSAESGLEDRCILFHSGRCLHGYFPNLMPRSVWTKYLGRLLILNEPGQPPVIDTRWVGYALMRGFGSLRWSHNTNRYLAIPRMARGFGRA